MQTEGQGSIKSNAEEHGSEVECKWEGGCQSERVGVDAKLDGGPY